MYRQDGVLDDAEAKLLDAINRKIRCSLPSLKIIRDLEEDGLVLHQLDRNGFCGVLTAAGQDALKAYQEKEQ